MDSTIKVRKAEVADLPILLTFEQGVIAAERPFDQTLQSNKLIITILKK